MRPQAFLLALLATLVATTDSGRLSLIPGEAHAAPSLVPAAAQRIIAKSNEQLAVVGTPSQKQHETLGVRTPLAGPIQKVVAGGALLHFPDAATLAADGSFDLVIHFHGGASIVEPQLDRAGLDAALLTINLGNGSRAYTGPFSNPARFGLYLEAVELSVRQVAPDAKVGRIALSAWSAGYGALFSLLSHDEIVERIDAVLVTDGIHAGFRNLGMREIHPIAMAPFVDYAARAAEGEKYLLITHSGVRTLKYSNTTESAAYLREATDTSSACDHVVPAGMRMTNCHERGNFKVAGYAGRDKAAHASHVRNMDELVLEPLLQHWSQ